MIRYTKNKFKNAILAKENKMAAADNIFKFSKIEKWSARPDLNSLKKWSLQQTKKSRLFYQAPEVKIRLKNGLLKFDSPVKSPHKKNNKTYAQYFKSPRPTQSAVIILGHWNSDKKSYNQLANLYRLGGISAIRLSLPYHDERRPATMPIATGMLSADLNQTIQSMQQATIEAKILVSWLQSKGYENIGIIGASLGSSVALLAAAHDERIKAAVLYLSAADTPELIWQSTATAHLRQSFGPDFSIEDLRKAWSCINPANYLHQLARKDFAVHVAWGRYDEVCPVHLTQRMLREFRKLKVPVSDVRYPCGHNTLALAPFIHVAGLRGLAFMRKCLNKSK